MQFFILSFFIIIITCINDRFILLSIVLFSVHAETIALNDQKINDESDKARYITVFVVVVAHLCADATKP